MTREEAIEAIKEAYGNSEYTDEIIETLKQQKTGYWIFDDKCREHGHCSACGYGSVDLVNGEPHNFCRQCGAKMIGVKEK